MSDFVSLKVAAEKKIHGDDVAKATHFNVKPGLIQIEPGFNRPISREKVESFKTSIRSGATIPPIFVRVDVGSIIMVDGEHRLIAVNELIADGFEVESMSAIQFRGDDGDRIAHLCNSASGHGMTPLEKGEQFIKLIRINWSVKKIADRCGESTQTIERCLALAEAGTDVKAHITNGSIASTEAAKIVRDHGSRAGAVITDRLTEAKAAGKKRVTAATGKPKASNAELLAAIRQIPDSVTGEWADKIRSLIGVKP